MTNQTLEVLKNRRSIRSYKPEQIPDELLNAVTEAGTYAPTGGGRQTPVIVAVQDPATIKKLSAMNAKIMGKDTDPYYGAPTVLIVLDEAGKGEADGASVVVNLLNAAFSVGLGSCWIAREKEMFETDEGKALLKEWGLQGEYRGIAAVLLGYPEGEHPVPKPRKDNYVIKVK